MKSCPNCNSKLSTQTVLKTFWSLKRYTEFRCPACHEKLNHTTSNRIFGGLIVGVAIFVSMTYTSTHEFSIDKTLVTISIMLCAAFALSVIAVQFFKFKRY